jgi:hypothetical protein
MSLAIHTHAHAYLFLGQSYEHAFPCPSALVKQPLMFFFLFFLIRIKLALNKFIKIIFKQLRHSF